MNPANKESIILEGSEESLRFCEICPPEGSFHLSETNGRERLGRSPKIILPFSLWGDVPPVLCEEGPPTPEMDFHYFGMDVVQPGDEAFFISPQKILERLGVHKGMLKSRVFTVSQWIALAEQERKRLSKIGSRAFFLLGTCSDCFVATTRGLDSHCDSMPFCACIMGSKETRIYPKRHRTGEYRYFFFIPG